MNQGRKILVGDNPFQGVSHLSRERVLQRPGNINDVSFAAGLVMTSIASGATGFTFTVNETTLAIVDEISRHKSDSVEYYPLVPDVAEMVRVAGSAGGIPGLARKMAVEMVTSMDGRLLLNLVRGALINDPGSLLRSYLLYEYHRLRHAIGKGSAGDLKTILLHEIITDMAIALDMAWLFRAHIRLMAELGIRPGFETRNLPYLAKQLEKWQLDTSRMVIEAPFNASGFQMCPSRADCEAALEAVPQAEVIAFSVLAAGYLKPPEAFDYVSGLKGLSGVAVGVSSEEQAAATFSLARRVLN
jgi:hypothetical protein